MQIDKVKAKVVSIGKYEKQSGGENKIYPVLLADSTGYIKLKLWNEQIDAVNVQESYCFTRVVNKEFNGEPYITATKSSTINKIANVHIIDKPAPPLEEEMLYTVETKVVASNLVNEFDCPICNKKHTSFDLTQVTNYCDGCKNCVRSSEYKATTTGTLHVFHGEENRITELNVSNSVLTSFLDEQGWGNEKTNIKVLVDKFFTLDGLTISFNNYHIIKKMTCACKSGITPQVNRESTSDAEDAQAENAQDEGETRTKFKKRRKTESRKRKTESRLRTTGVRQKGSGDPSGPIIKL